MAEELKTSNVSGREGRSQRRARIGVVESDARDKTIKVRIDRLIKHSKYGKYLKQKTALHAHDEKNEAKVGDVVEIVECRPISKTKSWRLSRFVNRTAEGR
ncbi:MAG: 30S ribosomal protein S17 [Phycisphaerales bacterium]|nr:30S ribosomal protein S17 [Phycisphaerales bacterium]